MNPREIFWILSELFLYGSFFFFCKKRLLNYLRFFQQEDYRPNRFFKWLSQTSAWDRKATSLLTIGFLTLFFLNSFWVSLLIASVFFFLYEDDPRHFGKVTLKMTERAKRIHFCSLGLLAFVLAASSPLVFSYRLITWVLIVQALPLILIGAWALLQPGEKKRQDRLLSQAKIRLEKINPFVIGITGSYGKTSTKHALGFLLNATLGPAFVPKGSVNTLMGITREINENLKNEFDFAVMEMAAYGVGSIQKLADFTNPKAAILTNIGFAHLERFKTQEAIIKAKSELAEALPKEAFLICNGDCLKVREIAKKHADKKIIFYGFNKEIGPLDLLIEFLHADENGTKFYFLWEGKKYFGSTKLFGKALLSNVAAAFALSAKLGADPDLLIASIYNIENFNNRLEVQKRENVTYIKDAYNSNPQGFMDALNVLENLSGKRKIIMTPGMIELGSLQFKENERLAKRASEFVDLALIIGSTNKDALSLGLKNSPAKIYFFKTRDEAFHFLKDETKTDDVILIENDLTDLYEPRKTF